jgi:hypothetical protein
MKQPPAGTHSCWAAACLLARRARGRRRRARRAGPAARRSRRARARRAPPPPPLSSAPPPAAGCWRGWPRLALRHCLPHHPASAGQATEWSMPLTAAAAAWVLLLPCGLAAAAGVRAAPRAAAAAASGSPKPPNFIFVLADDWVCAPHWSVSRNAGTTQSHAACRAGVTSASTWRAAQGSSGIRRHTRRSWTEWLRRVSSSPTFTPHHPSVRRPEWGS